MAKQKAGMLGIIMGVIVLAMCAISIAGLAVDEWTVYKGEAIILGESEDPTSFGEYSDMVIGEEGEDLENIQMPKDWEDAESLETVMVVFGYIAVIGVCALAVLYLLKMVLNFGLMRFFVGIVGILTLAAGAVLTGVTASYCADYLANADIVVFSGEMVMGVGAYLSCIGTMAGGLAAVIGVARK